MARLRTKWIQIYRQAHKAFDPALRRELPISCLILFPLSVFILGHLIFDWIGIPFSSRALQAAQTIAPNPNTDQAISDGHAWGASAYFYLIVSAYTLAALTRWAHARISGKTLAFYRSVAAFVVFSGLLYLAAINSTDRPLKTIFLFTFNSLQLSSSTIEPQILRSISITLLIINLLGVIVPGVICAVAPLVVREPDGEWTEKELFNRTRDMRFLGLIASVFMVTGILHMYAWMSWAPQLLNKNDLEILVGSVAFYWGSVFTMMLAAIYFPILFVLQSRAESIMDAQQIPLIERDQWLERRGLSLRITNQIPQIIAILAPLLTAPSGNFLASLARLAPK